MKAPSSTLVVDAAVLVAAARGRSSGAVLVAARSASLATTDRVVHEARRRIELGLNRPELLEILDALIAEITVVPVAALAPHLPESEIVLRDLSQAAMARSGTPTYWRWRGASTAISGAAIATSPEPGSRAGPPPI